MSEKREFRITLEVEPTIYALIELVLTERKQSMAGFVREAIIRDLEQRGLMTKEVLMRLAV